jgi:preprotein translocase subunit SecD
MDKGQASGEAAQIAVTIDNHVVTAPSIMAVIPGDAQISGGDLSTRDGANALAATLSHGVLPVRLVIDALETVR